MRARPEGPALLDTACEVLREQVLPALPAAQRHALLMVINAVETAARQMSAGEAPAQAELAALAGLNGHGHDDLVQANRQLVGRIRSGQADPGTPGHDAVLAHLRTVTRQRLVESSPKTLAGG
ncbi:MAG: DUF6285 domain-containing protein [Burkholderiales bacterium]